MPVSVSTKCYYQPSDEWCPTQNSSAETTPLSRLHAYPTSSPVQRDAFLREMTQLAQGLTRERLHVESRRELYTVGQNI